MLEKRGCSGKEVWSWVEVGRVKENIELARVSRRSMCNERSYKVGLVNVFAKRHLSGASGKF
jgi:hypothetical protein